MINLAGDHSPMELYFLEKILSSRDTTPSFSRVGFFLSSYSDAFIEIGNPKDLSVFSDTTISRPPITCSDLTDAMSGIP